MGRRGPKPDYTKRDSLAELLSRGFSLSEAARTVGVNRRTAKRWRNGRSIKYSDGRVLKLLPVISAAHQKEYSPRYLSEDERLRLADLRREKRTMREIARLLGRAPSTISRELRRGSDSRGRYYPFEAHRRALGRRRVQRSSQLSLDPVLREWVADRLQARWSPEQIAQEARRRFPTNPTGGCVPRRSTRPCTGPTSAAFPGNCPAGCCADAAGNEYPAATPNYAAAAR